MALFKPKFTKIIKVCIVTGSRSEYGLLQPLMKKMSLSHEFQMQLVVTGSHFSKAFGETYREIEADGFKIDFRIPMEVE